MSVARGQGQERFAWTSTPRPPQPPRPSSGRGQLHPFRDLTSRLDAPRGRPPRPSQGFSGLGREAARAGRAWLGAGLRGRAQLHPPHPAPRPGSGGLLGAQGWAVTPPSAPPPSGPFPWRGTGRGRRWGRCSPPRSWVGRRHQQLTRAQRPLARTERAPCPSHPPPLKNNNKICSSRQFCGPGCRVGGRAGRDWAEGGEGGRAKSQSARPPHPGLHAHHPPPTPHLHVVQTLEAPPSPPAPPRKSFQESGLSKKKKKKKNADTHL